METGMIKSPSDEVSSAHPFPNSDQSGRRRSKQPGGWRAIKYILGNEAFEKLASMSLQSNMTVYLRTKYNLGGIFLVNVVTIWSGSTNVSSIAGAVISDAFLGRFLTLLFGSIFSLLGMGAITLTAGLPQLRPPPCQDQLLCIQPHKWQLAFLITGLALISIGAGGIRPCNIAFGADQFDTNTAKGRAGLESFFNWWYFSFTIALIIALTGVVYVQTNISWLIGFAIPTACFVVSISLFVIGCHTYIYRKPQGSVFVDLAKVMVAAFKKRKINLKSGDEHSYYDTTIVELEPRKYIKYIKIDKFLCLDKAAVITDPSELDDKGKPKNNWRLCSVQQVENLKCLVGILPVWISGIGCFVVMDQQSTYGVLQAIQMNRSIGHFTIPPGWMGISSVIFLSIWILVYEQIYIRIAKKILKRDSRLTMQQRIGIGIVMSILCMLLAGFIEKKRRAMALSRGSYTSPLHVAALLPQFGLSGLTEAFAAVALMEFFTTQMPESLRSVAGSICFLSLSIASYLSSLIVNVVHAVTRRGGKRPWLGGNDLNMNKLDNYYHIIVVLGSSTWYTSSFSQESMCIATKVLKRIENWS